MVWRISAGLGPCDPPVRPALATVVRRGRSLCFTDVVVTEPDGRIVAKGSVVQRFG